MGRGLGGGSSSQRWVEFSFLLDAVSWISQLFRKERKQHRFIPQREGVYIKRIVYKEWQQGTVEGKGALYPFFFFFFYFFFFFRKMPFSICWLEWLLRRHDLIGKQIKRHFLTSRWRTLSFYRCVFFPPSTSLLASLASLANFSHLPVLLRF